MFVYPVMVIKTSSHSAGTQVLACSVGLRHCAIRAALPGALLRYFCKHLYCDEHNNNGGQSATVYTAELSCWTQISSTYSVEHSRLERPIATTRSC
jgi:hypothetical protein